MMSQEPNTTPEGWVYLIVDDRDEGCVKIGFTTRDPIHRAYELISTGTRGTFVVIYQAWVRNPARVEEDVHRRLSDRNVSGEWFEVCPDLAKREIVAAAGDVQFEKCVPRWHPSQREPRPWTRTVLQEARLAAEREAMRQAAAAEAARKEAQEQAIRVAQAAELARQQAEVIEKQKRVEQAAKAEAAALEAQRRRDMMAAAAKRRREWCLRISGSAVKAVGLIALSGLAVFTIAGPYSKTEVSRRRSLLEVAEKKATEIKGSLEAVRKGIKQIVEESSQASAAVTRLSGEAAAYENRIREEKKNLRYAEWRLADFRQRPPSASSRALQSELERLKEMVESTVKRLSDAEAGLKNSRAKRTALLLAKPTTERIKTLKTSEVDLQRSLFEQGDLVAAARKSLEEANAHNARWSWWWTQDAVLR